MCPIVITTGNNNSIRYSTIKYFCERVNYISKDNMYLSSHVVRSWCHSNDIVNVLNGSPATVNEGENLTNMLLMTVELNSSLFWTSQGIER